MGDLVRDGHCQVVLVGVGVRASYLILDKLTLFRCLVVGDNSEITAREYEHTFSSLSTVKLKSILEPGFNLDRTGQLHLKLSHLLHIEWRGLIRSLAEGGDKDFDKSRHALGLCTMHVPHHTEVTFKLADFTKRLNVVGLITLTANAHVLTDQRDSIELHSRHQLFTLLVQVQLHANLKFT